MGKPKENAGLEAFQNSNITENTNLKSDIQNSSQKEKGQDEEHTFQYFLDLVGTTGPWNYMVFILCASCSFMSPMQALSYQFLGGTPDHWCHVSELVEANWTQEQIVKFAIPVNNDTGKPDGCLMHNYNYSLAVDLGYQDSLKQLDILTIDSRSVKCPSRDFNLTDFQSTTVTEWDLVCDRRHLYSTTFSASFIVRLVTSAFIGYIIDAFGRRPSILVSTAMFIPCCYLAAVAPNYELYIILRILIAQFDACFYMASFVLSLELSGKAQRSMVGILFCVPWAFGYMAMPGIAYLIRDWRLLQVGLTAPSVYMLLYFWLLPESPRWLVSKGRYVEALQILKNAAKMNKRPPLIDDEILCKLEKLQSMDETEDHPDGCGKGFINHIGTLIVGFWNLVRSWPILRLTTVVMFSWFASAGTYYGLSVNSVNLSANIYIYMFLGGLLELPSYLLLWPMASFMGRKRAFVSLFVFCGVTIFTIPLLEEFAPKTPIAIKITLSLVGKMVINMAFQLAYLYTGELYHTSQRSFVVSLGSIFSAAGGAVSPYVNDLLVREATWAPSVTFATFSLVAGALTATLPETKGEELPDSVETVENAAAKRDEKD